MEIIYPDESLCLAAGEIKATESVSLADAFVAATAEFTSAVLIRRGGRKYLVFFQGRRNFHGFDLMSVVIEAENISKRFFLGERNQRAFFEDVAAKSARGFRACFGLKMQRMETTSKRDC